MLKLGGRERKSTMESGLYWLLSNRIIYWKLSGIVSMSELNTHLEQLIDTLEILSTGVIHIILDARGVKKFKPDRTDVRPTMRRLARHRALGKFQCVASNITIRQQVNRLTVDFGTGMLNSTTIQEAIQSLKYADATLPVILPEPIDLEPVTNFLQPE
jgi:hypothetical protein